MAIEVGDLVRFTNEYLKYFNIYSKRSKRYFRRKNKVMRVVRIMSETLVLNRLTHKMMFIKSVELDIQQPTIYDKSKAKPLVISVRWLAVVKKGSRKRVPGPSSLLRDVNLSARQVVSSGTVWPSIFAPVV